MEGGGDRPRDSQSPGPLLRFLGRREKLIDRRGLRPRDAAYVIIAVWVVGVVVFGVVIRLVDPETYDNVWLGMWWALQTVTTVGYGDVVPGQTDGKVIASFMMLGGLSLIAVVTGAVTSAFVTSAQRRLQEEGDDPAIRRLDEMNARLDRIEAELGRRGGSGDA